MKLFRPVGLKELHKIIQLDFKGFPPRLPQQPIFYPVIFEEYANEIASKWNTKDSVSDYVGYVLEFDVDDIFISKYKVETVGNTRHKELWIPAEDLDQFNANIIGNIKINRAYYGTDYTGIKHMNFKGQSLDEQFNMIIATYDYNKMDFDLSVLAYKDMIISNYNYWKECRQSNKDIEVLDHIFEIYMNQNIFISSK